MLASNPSQHLESELRPLGNPYRFKKAESGSSSDFESTITCALTPRRTRPVASFAVTAVRGRASFYDIGRSCFANQSAAPLRALPTPH